MLNSYTQPYFGSDVCWPRLVILPEANGLVLSHPRAQWNTADIARVNTVLPCTGTLVARIDRPFAELADMQYHDVWPQHSRVGTVVIHGAFNPDARNDPNVCSAPYTSETTKTHKVIESPAGSTVHVLSEDFFASFCTNYKARPEIVSIAFNHALIGIPALRLDVRSPYEEQFAQGVASERFYDIVCVSNDPYVGLTCRAYRTKYRTLAS